MSEELYFGILRELRNGPLSDEQLGKRLDAKPNDCRHACYDLADMGRVCRSICGRWEKTSGGYCPDPDPKGAA